MLLAIDVGNTQTHLGVFSGEELVAQWRTRTEPNRTADELALTLHQLLGSAGLDPAADIGGAAVSSVVPAISTAVRDLVARHFDFSPVMVEPGIKTGMPILIENPGELGADRICNSVAAYALAGGPSIVVDFGTATTLDAVSAKGEYLGGAIAPGVQISADALSFAAARIPRVELVEPRSVVGRTTVESLRSGVVLGAAAMVEGMIRRMQQTLNSPARVVATGGLCSLVLPHCDVEVQIEPTLTLTGLRILYGRNA
ncbi:MAG: type III pantothenate kinase [Actinomycetota bacterium]